MIPRRLQRRPLRTPQFVIEVPGYVTAEQVAMLREQWNRACKSGSRVGILTGGAIVRDLRRGGRP